MTQKKVNRKFKDRLFRLVFHDKSDLLELYNAINLSDYSDSEKLEITTLKNVVYMGMKNDISFLVDDILNLYENQSTFNPNMPVRGLFYLTDLYRKYTESQKLNLYSSHLVKLPFPQYLVFYNGLKEQPDRLELKLSDAFESRGDMESCLEVKAVMININPGHNRELMERCPKLKEYARFVAIVREYLSEGLPLEEAVDMAVERCIKEGILAEFLLNHRAEVHDMVLTEYDEQHHMACERAESKAEGKAEGKAEFIIDLLSDLGEIPEDIKIAVIRQRDLDVLKNWHKIASGASTMEEFREQIGMK